MTVHMASLTVIIGHLDTVPGFSSLFMAGRTKDIVRMGCVALNAVFIKILLAVKISVKFHIDYIVDIILMALGIFAEVL
jgi:hypothetical protein